MLVFWIAHAYDPDSGRRMSPYVGTSVSDRDVVGWLGLSLSSPGHCFVLLWPLSPASRPGLGRSICASPGKLFHMRMTRIRAGGFLVMFAHFV